MKIRLARTAGFCMGVRRAVDMVLDLRRDSPPPPIVTYGPLIHNPQTLQILKSKGISEVASVDEIQSGTVVIRAHGISPQERQLLEDKGVRLIDATCPRVARVQWLIRKHAAENHFCVIVGDQDHPEVRGLMGFASAGGVTVSSPDDTDWLSAVPRDREICVVAQTTQERESFQKVVDALTREGYRLHVYNTICDSTKKRQAEVSLLARQADMIVVVGGKGSGNTRRLVKVAEAQGVPALHVETEDEIPEGALAGMQTIGVTAGASTPNWQIRRVITRLKDIERREKPAPLRYLRRIAEVAVMTYATASVGGAGLTAACQVLEGRNAAWLPPIVTMLFVFSMHILNRVQERSGAVRFNMPEIAAFYVRHRTVLTTLGVASSAGSLALSYWMGWHAFLLVCGMLVMGHLYGARVLPERGFFGVKWRSLKDVPGLKTPLVAMGWGVGAAVLPAVGSGEPVNWPSVAVAFSFAAGMVFWRAAVSDLSDIQGDRIEGRATIPILTGVKRTSRLLVTLLSVLGILVVSAAATRVIPLVGLWLLVNIVFFGVFHVVYWKRPLVDRLVMEGMMDGNLLLAGAISML